MALVPSTPIDVIATQILLDAKSALASLKLFNTEVTNTTARMAALKGIISSVASQLGGDFKKAEASVKAFSGSLTGIKSADVAQAGREVRQLGNRWEETSKKSKYSIDVIRTALGVLTAMLVNVVLSAIVNFAKQSVKAFMDIEESLWRIRNAEIALSKQGVEISFKGMTEGIKKIKEELKIFSEGDLLKGASKLSISLQQFGFTEEQILSFTRAAAILNIVSTEDEEYIATVDKLITAMLSGTTKGVSGLTVVMSDMAIAAKAVDMHLLKAGESADKLGQKEKALVKLQIVLDAAAASGQTLDEYLETNAAKLKENSASWEDVQKAAGGFFTQIIPNLNWLYEFLINMISAFKGLFAEVYAGLQTIGEVFGEFIGGLIQGKSKAESLADALKNVGKEYKAKVMVLIDSAFANDMPEWLRKGLEGRGFTLPQIEETPTAPQAPAGLAGATQEETEAFDELAKKLAEVAAEAQNAYDDLERLTTQKAIDIHADLIIDIEDIDTEFAQKMEDVERELQQTLEDIAIDTQNKIADLKAQAREDEMRAELEFQQKMKELREQFLMDLDDALHARDARQVLRLIKQYEVDKRQALERKRLEDKLRAEKLAADIKAAQLEEQRKIAEAQREAARKMQELEIEKQREIDAANEKAQRKLDDLILWNQREAEEIARHAQEKNDKLVAAYEAEFGIHSYYEGEINKLIAGYAAANIVAIDEMYAHMAGVYANIAAMYAASQAMLGGLGGYVAPAPVPIGGYAEGGSVIANRPTIAIFGERGREMATFTPLDRTGRDVNKVFGNTSGLGGSGGGRVLIEMTLSPDLEARVVENSLSRTAEIVARVSRSK